MARIARTNSEFNDYANSSLAYMDALDPAGIANYVRLGITVAQRNAWAAKRNDWNAIYALYVNRATRTGPVIEDKDKAMKAFIVLVQPLLNIIAASPAITSNDYAAFNIKERDTEPTPKPAITTAPFAKVLPIGGGKVKVRVRVLGNSTRASMHPDADAIEMRYTIGNVPPTSQEEAEETRSYKKALRTFGFGQAQAGKRLYAFYRWLNETDEAKSGPWSTMVQTVIA